MMLTRIYLALGAAFLLSGQPSAELHFSDNTSVPVVATVTEAVSGIKVRNQTLEGSLQSIGKAVRLSSAFIREVHEADPALARQLRGVTTAYAIRQGSQRFYLAGLRSIPSTVWRSCQSCPVEAQVRILEITTASGRLLYLPLLTSLTHTVRYR